MDKFIPGEVEYYHVVDESRFDDETKHYDLLIELLHNTPRKVVRRFRDIETIIDSRQRNRLFEYIVKSKKTYKSKTPVKNSLNIFKYGKCRTWYLYSL